MYKFKRIPRYIILFFENQTLWLLVMSVLELHISRKVGSRERVRSMGEDVNSQTESLKSSRGNVSAGNPQSAYHHLVKNNPEEQKGALSCPEI